MKTSVPKNKTEKRPHGGVKEVASKDDHNAEMMTGAEIVVASLKNEDVAVVFAYPGGSIIPVFDALYNDKDIRLILPRHEQAGGHEAEGYARATGKVGVVITTGGPGATNITTVLADAYMDSTPLVAISGQVKTHLIGTDAFQEADMTGISHGITKNNYLVKDVRDIARTIKEAFYIASTGRPGPVHIAIPVDLQTMRTTFDYPTEIHMRNYSPTYKGNAGQIKRACEAIHSAKQPIILVGGGIVASGAAEEVRMLIKKTGIPTVSTLMGLGVIPSETKEFLGMLGMHGTVTANSAMGEADLIINIGARFDDRVTGNTKTFAKKARIIHIDIDPSSIGKVIDTYLPVVGDIKQVLRVILESIEKPSFTPWQSMLQKMKKEHPIRYRNASDGINPEKLFDAINAATKGARTIFTTEVGQHQMWAAQLLHLNRPRQFITSGGLGTMGFGFPAAIGAQSAFPDATVVCLAGDGSFQMNLQELALLRPYRLPVKTIIINNGYLGMVRQWQEMFHEERYSATCLSRTAKCPLNCSGKMCREYDPDFVKLSEAYNIPGYRARTEQEMETIFAKIFDPKDREPALVEIWVPKFVNVMPMVPPGGSLSDTIEYDPKELKNL